jgi:predicted methyltransferase
LAHDVRSYYYSLKRSKFIEQNPDCEWIEYATVDEVRNLLSKPLPDLSTFKFDINSTKEQREQAKIEAKAYLSNHNKKKREEAFLKETQEKQAMYLWHIQQLFRNIIERGVKENDNEK